MTENKSRHHNYQFTSYDMKDVMERIDDKTKVRYCIYQKEACPTTGRHHWQGYIEMNEKYSKRMMQKIFKENVHLEVARSPDALVNYCQKSKTKIGPVVEYGTQKKQGKRTELDAIYKDIERGKTKKEILNKHKGAGLKYIGLISKAVQIHHELDYVDKYILEKRQMEAENGGAMDDDMSTVAIVNKKQNDIDKVVNQIAYDMVNNKQLDNILS